MVLPLKDLTNDDVPKSLLDSISQRMHQTCELFSYDKWEAWLGIYTKRGLR